MVLNYKRMLEKTVTYFFRIYRAGGSPYTKRAASGLAKSTHMEVGWGGFDLPKLKTYTDTYLLLY